MYYQLEILPNDLFVACLCAQSPVCCLFVCTISCVLCVCVHNLLCGVCLCAQSPVCCVFVRTISCVLCVCAHNLLCVGHRETESLFRELITLPVYFLAVGFHDVRCVCLGKVNVHLDLFKG